MAEIATVAKAPVYVVGSNISCGILELYNISNHNKPEDIVDQVFPLCDGSRWTYTSFLFSDNVIRDIGDRLEQFIHDNKLGEVISSPAFHNVRYEATHKVKMWLWILDQENCKAYYDKLEKPAPKKTTGGYFHINY